MKLGTKFGIKVLFDGLEPNKEFALRYIYKFPEDFKNRIGEIHERDILYAKSKADARGSFTAVCGYTLGHDFLLVRGKWKFEFWHEGKKIIEKEFAVYKP